MGGVVCCFVAACPGGCPAVAAGSRHVVRGRMNERISALVFHYSFHHIIITLSYPVQGAKERQSVGSKQKLADSE